MLTAGRAILMTAVLAVCSTALGDQWNITVVDSAGSQGKFSSIRLDGDDRPHIAYIDQWQEDLKYTRWDGGSWNPVTVYDQCMLGYTTLRLVPPQPPDTLWLPRISSYYSHEGYDAVLYSAFNGTSWDNVFADYSTVGEYASMDLDADYNPHLAYMDVLYCNLKYAYFDGSSWTVTLVDSDYLSGLYTSIAVEPGTTDQVHISYYDYDDKDLMYAYFDGASWDISTVDSAGDVGAHSSLALDSNNYPRISYYDNTGDDLMYAMWNGSSWEITRVDTLANTGTETSMVLDSQDRPHISYQNLTYGSLKYAHFNGSSWEVTTVDPDAGYGAGSHNTSIDLDSGGNPHITYWNGHDYDLMYAYYGPVGIEGQEPAAGFMLNAVYPCPSSGSVTVAFTVPASSSVAFQVYDVSGRIVRETDTAYGPGDHTLSLNGLGTGVYFLRMNAGAFFATGRFLVLR